MTYYYPQLQYSEVEAESEHFVLGQQGSTWKKEETGTGDFVIFKAVSEPGCSTPTSTRYTNIAIHLHLWKV